MEEMMQGLGFKIFFQEPWRTFWLKILPYLVTREQLSPFHNFAFMDPTGFMFMLIRYPFIKCLKYRPLFFIKNLFLIFFLLPQVNRSLLANSTNPNHEQHTISAAEYAAFLNSVATTDNLHLYEQKSGSGSLGGLIIRKGESGHYHYELIDGNEKKPVSYINDLNKTYYCNWVDHGSPTTFEEEASNPSSSLNSHSISFLTSPQAQPTCFFNVDSSRSTEEPSIASNTDLFLIAYVNNLSSLSLATPSKKGAFENSFFHSSFFQKAGLISFVVATAFMTGEEGAGSYSSTRGAIDRAGVIHDPLGVDTDPLNQLIGDEEYYFPSDDRRRYQQDQKPPRTTQPPSEVEVQEPTHSWNPVKNFRNWWNSPQQKETTIDNPQRHPSTDTHDLSSQHSVIALTTAHTIEEDRNPSTVSSTLSFAASSDDINSSNYVSLRRSITTASGHSDQDSRLTQGPQSSLGKLIFWIKGYSSIYRDSRIASTSSTGSSLLSELSEDDQSLFGHQKYREGAYMRLSTISTLSDNSFYQDDDSRKFSISDLLPTLYSRKNHDLPFTKFSSPGREREGYQAGERRSFHDAEPEDTRCCSWLRDLCGSCFKQENEKEPCDLRTPLISAKNRTSDEETAPETDSLCSTGDLDSFDPYENQQRTSESSFDTNPSEQVEQAILETQIRRRNYIDLLEDPEEHFVIIAGEARGYLSQTHRQLTGALKTYKKSNNASLNSKKTLLDSIEKIANNYLLKEEKSLHKKDISSQDQLRLQDRMEACNYLLRGIAVERFCLEHKTSRDLIRFRPKEVRTPRASFSDAHMSAPRETISDGFHDRLVFKSVDKSEPMKSTAAANMGIPTESTTAANLAGRAIAFQRITHLLGLKNLVPETDFALSQEGVVGFCQHLVNGISLFKQKRELISDQEMNEYINRSICLTRSVPEEGGIKRVLLTPEEINDEKQECFSDLVKAAINNYTLPPNWELIIKSPLRRANDGSIINEDGRSILLQEAEQYFKKGSLAFAKKNITSIASIDFSYPSLQQALSNAGLIDLLTAQIDRHPLNFIFEQLNDGTWRLHLIDNDLSFAKDFKNLSERQLQALPRSAHTLRELPRLIDYHMAVALKKLTVEELRTSLDGTHLTEEEINATETRLENLQQHISNIEQEKVPGGEIVREWNERTFELLKQKNNDQDDNYLSRTLDDLKIILEKFKTQQGKITHPVLGPYTDVNSV